VDELAASLLQVPTGELAIVAGDEVARSGAVSALVRVAELLDAPVWAAPLHGVSVFPTTHRLWRGALPSSASAISSTLSRATTVFYVGGQVFKVYPWSPGSPLPAEVALLHLSPDPAELGRVWPTQLGLAADPRLTLAALADLLDGRPRAHATPADPLSPSRSADEIRAERAREVVDRYANTPMEPDAAAFALVDALPPDVPVVNEAITTGVAVRDFLVDPGADRYFFARGGGLGWGMPAAVGVSLGRDRHPVLCVVGDGSAMYSPQALWTAAREHVPVVFAVVNNRSYLILKQALERRRAGRNSEHPFVGMDLDDPPIDFCSLAMSMGVRAQQIEKAVDVGDAVQAALASGGPHVLELPIAS
jgi:benzoylformate decarboxylase